PAGRGRRLLWLRRALCREDGRRLRRDARAQVPPDRRGRRRHRRRDRRELCHAHAGRARAAGAHDEGAAHRRGAGRDARPGNGAADAVTPAPLTFHRRAAAALADARLQEALDISTGRMTAARRQAFAALEAGEAVRDHARRIRQQTVTHLGAYLEQFVAQARAAGAVVTFAPTAQAAAEY